MLEVIKYLSLDLKLEIKLYLITFLLLSNLLILQLYHYQLQLIFKIVVFTFKTSS